MLYFYRGDFMSKPTSAVKDRYNKKAYDSILLRVPKGKKDIIQAHAQKQDESTNAFILRAIKQAIENDIKKEGNGY